LRGVRRILERTTAPDFRYFFMPPTPSGEPFACESWNSSRRGIIRFQTFVPLLLQIASMPLSAVSNISITRAGIIQGQGILPRYPPCVYLHPRFSVVGSKQSIVEGTRWWASFPEPAHGTPVPWPHSNSSTQLLRSSLKILPCQSRNTSVRTSCSLARKFDRRI